jgi:hypothetical protein
MITCDKLVAGGPCKRPPGHGGQCLSGHLIPVEPVFTPETIDFDYIARRAVWRALCNREIIRFVLFGMMIIAQLWIDAFLIILWAR